MCGTYRPTKDDAVERGPYGEDVETQTRRAYVFARAGEGTDLA